MVYLAEHPALAALEVRVHLDLPFELLPDDFVLMRSRCRTVWSLSSRSRRKRTPSTWVTPG